MALDDGAEQEIEATLIAVGNGPSYGGGMRICTDASMDDGLFDITVVGRCSRTTLLRVFPKVYKGIHQSPSEGTLGFSRGGIAFLACGSSFPP